MTLDGVPSPLGNLTDGDSELDDVRPPSRVAEAAGLRGPKVSVLDRLQGVIAASAGVSRPRHAMTPHGGGLKRLFVTDEEAEEDAVPVKRQKVLERCKFWPVCKSGDECLYHHPTAQCK